MQLAAYYDFAKDGSLTPRLGPEFTFTRSFPGLMVDGDGFYREVPANQIRLQGGHWAANLHIDSNDFSTGSYFKLNSTVAQTAEDINGNPNNAWEVSSDGLGPAGPTTEFVGLRADALASNTIDRLMLYSCRVKAGAYDWVYAYASPLTSVEVWFNIAEGYVGTKESQIKDAGIIPDGNDFYRIWFVATSETSGERWYIGAAEGDAQLEIVNDTVITNMFTVQDFMAEDVGGKWTAWNSVRDTTFATSWSPTSADITFGQLDPDGGFNAILVTAQSTGNFRAQRELGIAEVNTYFDCMVAKAGTTPYLLLYNGTGADVSFDLSNGEVLIDETPDGYSVIDAQMEPIPGRDGWWFCWAKIEPLDPGVTANYPYWCVSNALGSVGATIGDSVYMYRPQFEVAKPNQTRPGPFLENRTGDERRTYFPSNFMATDTDPVTMVSGPCEGMRLDPNRINLALWSTDMTDALWSESSAVVSEQPILAPDARETAFRLIDNNDAGSGAVSVGQNIAVATSSQYTWAVDLHKDQNDWAALAAILFTTPVNSWAYFDLANGTVGTVDAGLDAAGIIPKGNGWYRCWITFTTDVADGNGFPAVYVADADGDITLARNGDNSIFMKMPQFELGRRPSMPIPTFATSVQRTEDLAKGQGDRISGMDECSVYVDIRFEHSSGSGASLGIRGFTGSETTSGCIAFYSQGANFRVNMRNPNDTLQTNFTIINAAVDYDDEHRVAICAGTADFRLFNNGSKLTGNTEEYATAIGNTIDSTYIWSSIGSAVLREMRVWNATFTDAQYERMTDPNAKPVFPGYDPNAKKKAAIDAALWNKAMTARTQESEDGDYTPYNNVG